MTWGGGAPWTEDEQSSQEEGISWVRSTGKEGEEEPVGGEEGRWHPVIGKETRRVEVGRSAGPAARALIPTLPHARCTLRATNFLGP